MSVSIVFLIPALLALLSIPLPAQAPTLIKGTRNVRLATDVHEAVAIGGVKDRLACDSGGSIYTVANRGYSSEFGAVVKISPDGKHFTRYNLADFQPLKDGHIEAYEVLEDGVRVLARPVINGNDQGAPKRYGTAYIISFDSAGAIRQHVRLDHEFGTVVPTGFATMEDGGIMIAGYELDRSAGTLKMSAYVFSSNGRLRSTIALSLTGTQATGGELVQSMSVLSPSVVRAGSDIVVLRGSTRDPAFLLSADGKLKRTVALSGGVVEFSSPMISGDRLIVHLHRPVREGNRVLSESDPDEYAVFDLRTGALIERLAWRSHGELACFDGTTMTIVQQDLDHPATSYWAIVRVEPVRSPRAASEPDPVAPVTVQFRWVVPCSADMRPFSLEGDEAATAYCLSEDVIVDEQDIDSAAALDDLGRLGLALQFNAAGAVKLRRSTRENIGRALGVVINSELIFRAVVMDEIGDSAVISGGSFDRQRLLYWVERLTFQADLRRGKKPI